MEILISMSLFTLIGLAVVLLMRTGVDIWLRGTEGDQTENRREMSLPRLTEDLRQLVLPRSVDRIPFDPDNPDPSEQPDALPPDNRFISGYVTIKRRDQDIRCRYLAFVRDAADMPEVAMYASRSGRSTKADAYIDGKEDDREFKEYLHLPTGGAAEVLWIWLPDEHKPGIGSVCRAYRSPIGGPGTLLNPKNFDEIEKIQKLNPQPVFQNVALFDLLFWTQYTTTWEWSSSEPSVTKAPEEPTNTDRKFVRQACGPSNTWDSTRGLLPKEVFKLSRGEASYRFSGDDIWPRAVRVEFALAESDTLLARPLGTSDRDFTVIVSDFATGHGDLTDQLMKIDWEWIQISGRSGRSRDTFGIARRGVRGTQGVAHGEGAPVYYGRVFDVTISIPAFRDDNN